MLENILWQGNKSRNPGRASQFVLVVSVLTALGGCGNGALIAEY